MRLSYIHKSTHRYRCLPYTYIHVPVRMLHAHTLTHAATAAAIPLGARGRGQMADRTHYCLPPLLLKSWLPWALTAILQNTATGRGFPADHYCL